MHTFLVVLITIAIALSIVALSVRRNKKTDWLSVCLWPLNALLMYPHPLFVPCALMAVAWATESWWKSKLFSESGD
jgi:hypothetical protein